MLEDKDKRRRRRRMGFFLFLTFVGVIVVSSTLPPLLTNAPLDDNTTTTTTTSTTTQTSTTSLITTPPVCNYFDLNVTIPSVPFYRVGQNIQYFNGLIYWTANSSSVTIVTPIWNFTISNIVTNGNDIPSIVVDNRTGDVYVFGFFQSSDIDPNLHIGIKINSLGVQQWTTPLINTALLRLVNLDQTRNLLYDITPTGLRLDINLTTGQIVQQFPLNVHHYVVGGNYHYGISDSPQRVCRFVPENASEIWCVALPGDNPFSGAYALTLDSNTGNVYVMGQNSSVYFYNFDSNGNLLLTSSVTSNALANGFGITNPILFYMNTVYTVTNDCNVFPCATMLISTNPTNGASVIQNHPFVADELVDYALAVSTTNILYFGGVNYVTDFNNPKYRISSFCL
jgi:hypothetical protein